MSMSEASYKALLLAVQRHHGQLRKGGGDRPYVIHPVRVARTATREGAALGFPRERLIVIEVVALLHDTIEDTGLRHDEVREGFGDEVAHLVALLTQDKSLPKAERKAVMIEAAGSWPREARLIKLADRLDNVEDLAASVFDEAFRAAYLDESERLLERLRGTAPALEDRLARAIASGRGRSGAA